MTMIVHTGLEKFTVVVADRRLSMDGKSLDEEYNKVALVSCQDARFSASVTTNVAALLPPNAINPTTWPNAPKPGEPPVVGHPPNPGGAPLLGPERPYTWSVGTWMLEAMLGAAAPDCQLDGMTRRFTAAATRQWATMPNLGGLETVFCLAGYRYRRGEAVATPFFTAISNMDDPAAGFKIVDSTTNRVYTAILGQPGSMPADWIEKLKRRVHDPKRHRAGTDRGVLARSVQAIRAASHSKLSGGTVGSQCSSLIIPSEPDEPVIPGYYTERISYATYGPGLVDARGGGRPVVATKEVSIWVRPEDGPIAGPIIHRDSRCWCGSGKRYKQCHGDLRGATGLAVRIGPA